MHSRVASGIVRLDQVAPVPWRNGGGVTRELLAWPAPQDWLLRVSVAEVGASGPFSVFPGVDRSFAVLGGDGVRLATAGQPALDLTAADSELHAFPGDAATDCTLLGSATRDLNLMVRRAHARLETRALPRAPVLATSARLCGLFVTAPTVLTANGAALEVPAMALAWWDNPRGERHALEASPPHARGWWFELDLRPGA
jgi:environmental stress-induced protein Ves